MQVEIYKKIIGYQNYEVSNFGNVKNNKTNKVLTRRNNGKGYLTVILYEGLNKKNFRIHRLVAQYFIPNPLNLNTVNHINFDKSDNTVMNLEWASVRENNCHRFKDKPTKSMYIGVTFNNSTNKWVAQIGLDRKIKHLGTFNTEIEAYNCRVNYEKENNIINKYL